jgi:hypothetical protein
VRRRVPPVLPITPNPVYVQAVEEALALLAQVVVSAPSVTLPVPDPSGRSTDEPVEPPSTPHVDPEPADADVSDSSACARIDPCHGFDPPPSASH